MNPWLLNMDQTTLFLQNMLLLHLILKLWHLKLKAMASTLCLKLLCPLHPWLWNRTLMSLQSSLLQHPSVTELHHLHLGLNLNISVSVSSRSLSIFLCFWFQVMAISWSWFQYLSTTRFHLGLHHLNVFFFFLITVFFFF